MDIDKTRNQDMVGAFNEDAGLVSGLRLGERHDGVDATVANSHCVTFENLSGGLDRDAPAWSDQSVTMLHKGRSIRVAQDSASAAFQAF